MIDSKIKIMIVVPCINWGGTERFICLLANHLRREIFEVHLVVTSEAETIYELKEDIHFYDLATPKARNAIFKIRNLMRTIEPDIVFSSFSYFNLMMATCRSLFPKNIKFIARESIVLKDKLAKDDGKTYAYWYKKIAKTFLPNLDVLICQSNDMKASLEELDIHHSNIAVINNPVNIEQVQEKFQEPTDVTFDLVSVGRFYPQKGYDRFVKVIDIYKKKYNPNIRVAIIGGGPDKEKIATQIKEKGLEENIYLLGIQPNPFKFFQKASLFIMTSHFEGFPNVLIEAHACGMPVIAFQVPGGINEIVIEGVNGFTVPDQELEKMADKIKDGIFHPFDREEIRTIAKQKYSIATIFEQYEDLLITTHRSSMKQVEEAISI